ncbi:damage-control phosphatase ARMT1 family protein [Nocardia jiangxiensis]|uniref:Damage-control phosphatase ARMT1 family protein n=1 Tax=Nocardia jiangxiensis TaxID=282685 RepID=A0ABW6S6X0_9NOCA|nr:damage-control phosphatase ARMT1 family protein [Nocardia jiangxiensis]
MTAAPPILAGVPGTFPHSVFHDRHPVLIDQVIAGHPYDPAQRAALLRLLDESRDGMIEQLHTAAPDLPHWLAWGRDLWGRPWREASFLWAESYFYRRLLEAVGYFGPGAWAGVDPFAPKKYAELDTPQVAAELAALADISTASGDAARDALLRSALWGNQADLGFRLTAGPGTRSGLLADDSAQLWSALDGANDATVCLIADNAGRELLPDLVLADHLLSTGRAARIVLYLKPQPYYVSDATLHDLLAVLRLLRTAAEPQAQRIGQRLWQAMSEDRLVPRTHEFFCAPLTYHDLPADLTAELSTAAMTILKGDLNYRRLVGDRYWPPTTPFADLADYFPSPVTALRTLKCDVATGLPDGRAAELDAADPSWRTSGDYAVIQYARPRTTGDM